MTILGISLETWYIISAPIIWMVGMRLAASRLEDRFDVVMLPLFLASLWPLALALGLIVAVVYGLYRLATIGVDSQPLINPPKAPLAPPPSPPKIVGDGHPAE